MRTCLESTMRRMHLTPQKLLVPFGPEIFAAWFADFALRRTQSPVLPKINVPTFAGYTTMIWIIEVLFFVVCNQPKYSPVSARARRQDPRTFRITSVTESALWTRFVIAWCFLACPSLAPRQWPL
ncbi:hypothetical protein MRX96_019407 [Rhipicephalus microplus]